MSNKKTYTLEIKGVKESYNNVVNINEALDSMDNTIKNLNNVQKENRKVTDELTKARDKLEQITSKENQTYQAELAKTKAAIQAKNKELRDEAKLETTIEGSYYRKQATLSQLNKEIKSFVVTNEDDRIELEKKIETYNNLNSELKEFDSQMGNHQRNVGNYTSATRNLRSELREIEQTLREMMINGVSPSDEAFKELSKKGGELKEIIAQTRAEVDKFTASDYRIGEVVDVGRSLTSVYGLASATMQMFGSSSEKVQEQIQKLMVVMTMLNSLKEIDEQLSNKSSGTYKLLNKTLTLLGITKKKDAQATAQQATAQTAATVATTAGNTALKAFKIALASTGIGLFVVALGYVVSNFSDITDKVKEFLPFLNNIGTSFDKLKSILSGVGRAFIEFILTPINAIISVVKGYMEDGIKGAVNAGLKTVKDGYNVIGNYQKGYEKQQIKNNEKRVRENAKELDKQLKDELDYLEAKYGSDYKYTEDGIRLYRNYFNNKKNMYDKDSDEYKETINESLSFERELTERNKAENEKRNAEAERQANERKRLLETYKKNIEGVIEETNKLYSDNERAQLDYFKNFINNLKVSNQEELNVKIDNLRDIYNDENKLLNDKFNKEIEDTKVHYQDLINEAIKLGQNTEVIENDLNERLLLIEEKYQYEKLNLTNEYNDLIAKDNEKLTDVIINESSKRISGISKTLDSQLKNISEYNKDIVKTGGILNVIDVEATNEKFEKIKVSWSSLANTIAEESIKVGEEYDKQLLRLEELGLEETEQYTNILEQRTLALNKYTEDFQIALQNSTDVQKQQDMLLEQYWENVAEQVKEKFGKITEAIITPLFDVFSKSMESQIKESKEHLDEVNKLYQDSVDKVNESQSKINSLNDLLKNSNSLRKQDLKKTLADEVKMLEQREAKEQELLKESEKIKAEVEKKERIQAKITAGQQVLQSIVNTAVAVTKALPNIPLSVTVGALGAAQTALATSNFVKMEDGGLLEGKSHSLGGMKIEGTNIEVEGGEYVVNKNATAQFLPLLEKINNIDRPSTTINNNVYKKYETGGQLDFDNINTNLNNNNKLINIIDNLNKIDFNPVVSVQEITKKQNNVVRVKEIVGV